MLYQRIRCFLEVANCLSFSKAAENLYISQQAVTRQISALEEEIGVKLLYRTTRQVSLTPAGMLLRDDFTLINRHITDSIRRAKELERNGKDLLRVGFLSALSRKDVIVPIADYLKDNCMDQDLDFHLLGFIELRNWLLDGRLDFCVTTSNDWELWPGVTATVLQRKQFQIVCAERHPLAGRKTVEPEDLREYAQLILPREFLLEGVEQWARKIPCSRTILCPDITTMMVRLELGEGFALLTKVIEGHDEQNLCYWDVPFPEAHAEIVCLCTRSAGENIRTLIHRLEKNNIVEI